MAKFIPQDFANTLLKHVDIVTIIGRYLSLKKSSKGYYALCPFHQEKTPSFHISVDKQCYHCFGCHASGNALHFIMNYLRLDFVTAVENLANEVGLTIPNNSQSVSYKSSRNLYQLMADIKNFFTHSLSCNQHALAYLKKRSLSKEIIKKFHLGYAPPSWDNLEKRLGRDKRSDLITTGMIIAKNKDNSQYQKHYDHFRNRIMFPIFDDYGKIIGFGGRSLGDDRPKYLNSPETAIFQKRYALYGLYQVINDRKPLKKLVVVEGYMDVIALNQYNMNHVVATLGTAVSHHHLRRLFSLCPHVVFCFDGDQAGKKAAIRTLDIILPQLKDEWQIYFAVLPQGADPDSFIHEQGREKFAQYLDQALTLSTFLLEHLKAQANMTTIDGKARFASVAINYVKIIPSTIIRNLLLTEIATISNTRIEDLYKLVQQPKYHSKLTKNNVTNQSLSPINKAIMLLLQNPTLVNQYQPITPINSQSFNIFLELITLLQKQPSLSTAMLIEHWRDQPYEKTIKQLATLPHLIPNHGLEAEFRDILIHLNRQATKICCDALIEKSRKTPLTANEQKQFQSLIKKLNQIKNNNRDT